jgi:RNA polymerase sigma-70 factor (ECF subfamily)
MTSSPVAFEKDLAGFIPNLRAFAKSLSRNADLADDLVQETLIKAFQNKQQFQPGTNMKAWLFTILRNAYISHVRRQREQQFSVGESELTDLAVPPSQLASLDLADFSAALARLPVEQREALVLVGAEGFSYEEAADMCSCAVGTVKSRVNRARTRLAELLKLDTPKLHPASDHPRPGPITALLPTT